MITYTHIYYDHVICRRKLINDNWWLHSENLPARELPLLKEWRIDYRLRKDSITMHKIVFYSKFSYAEHTEITNNLIRFLKREVPLFR